MSDDFASSIDALLADIKDETRHEDVSIDEFEPSDGKKFDMEAFSQITFFYGTIFHSTNRHKVL